MVADKQTSVSSSNMSNLNDEMRIAWRYNTLDKVDSEQGSGSQSDGKNSYTFDLSQSIDEDTVKSLQPTLLGGGGDSKEYTNENSIFHNSNYVTILETLNEKIREPPFDVNDQSTPSDKKNLLRICIESFGSPLWYDNHFSDDICLFLTILKAAVRTSLTVCCITVPSHLFKYIVRYSEHFIEIPTENSRYAYIFNPQDPTLIHRVRNLVDYAVELESFAGSDKETNPVFKEYNGLFFIRKLAALNALTAHTPETYDLAFKLRRKRFVIEKLHLPPELQESEQREQDDEPILSSLSCASTKKHLLEF